MSKKSDNVLIIDIKVSLFLTAVFLVSGVGGVLILSQLSLPGGLNWLLAAAVLVSLYRLLCLHALRSARRAVRCLKLDAAGGCAMGDGGSDEWRECRVVELFVHPRLVILRLHDVARARRCDVLVPWDAVEENRFRELRVHAQLLRQPADA